jgi:hypothetical protein
MSLVCSTTGIAITGRRIHNIFLKRLEETYDQKFNTEVPYPFLLLIFLVPYTYYYYYYYFFFF